MNLSKTPVILKDGHSGKSAPIMQHDSFFVVEGDELSAGDWKMPIRSVPKANLSLFRKNFSKLSPAFMHYNISFHKHKKIISHFKITYNFLRFSFNFIQSFHILE